MSNPAQLQEHPDQVKLSPQEAALILAARVRRLDGFGLGNHERCCESAKSLWPKLWARATEGVHDPC